jgi:hypothetical protein
VSLSTVAARAGERTEPTESPEQTGAGRRARWPWIVFGLAAVASAVLVMYLGRDLMFFHDEWDWILRRRDPSLDVLLKPHVGHLSIIPVAVYQLFVWLFGLTHYEAFRALVLSLHLVCCTLAFVYLRRRVAPPVALAGAIVLLFYGSGWQDIIWPFQIGFLLSVAAGIGAFLLLGARTRRADIGASVCLLVALASSSVGVPVAVGMAVELVLRRRWRRLWVVAVPVAVYAIWYFTYGEPESRVDGPVELVRFVVEAAGAVIGSLLGVGMTVGQVLLLVVVPAFMVAVVRATPARRARLLGLAAVPVAFWTLLGISRAGFQPPDTSRYLYPAAVFVVLVTAECVRTVKFRTLALAAIVLVAGWSVVWNLGELRDGRDVLRDASSNSRIDLGAMRAGVRDVPRWYDAVRPPIPEVMRLYADAFDELGSPVAAVDEIATAPEAQRFGADGFLSAAVGLHLADPVAPDGPVPRVTRGTPDASGGSCLSFGGAGGGADAEVEADSRGLLVESLGATPVELRVRSFADGYFTEPNAWATVPASSARTLLVPQVAGRPWKLGVRSDGAVRVCAADGVLGRAA